MADETKAGFVYILTSPKSEYVKIGGTSYLPKKRIQEINVSEPYASYGPWTLHDFRQVEDWRTVEHSLHYIFRDSLVREIPNQKELFHTSPREAARGLEEIDPSLLVYRPKIDRMFQDSQFSSYLMSLFKISGLSNWLDIQGGWTLTLFPSTSGKYGSRYFTINIGLHEVAFSIYKDSRQDNMLYMDSLILDFEDIGKWILAHDGVISENDYKSALPHSLSVYFYGDFSVANEFLSLPGVRRAIIAYWTEALVVLQERDSLSIHSRFHNYNAVAEIVERIRLEGVR